jgi:hypothetical protein
LNWNILGFAGIESAMLCDLLLGKMRLRRMEIGALRLVRLFHPDVKKNISKPN